MSAKQILVGSLAFACGLGLAGCAPTQQPAAVTTPVAAPTASAMPSATLAPLTWDAVQPILTPLTYRDMIIDKCTMKEASPLPPFMAELKAAGASDDLLAQTEAEAARLRESERKTEPEYVCTAELFDSTEKNATIAQRAWAILKTHKP